MRQRNSNQVDWKGLIIRTGVLLGLFCGVYVWGFLLPKYKVYRVFGEVEKAMTKNQASLLDNKLAITAMVRLNPRGSGFNQSRTRVMETLVSSREQSIEELGRSREVPQVQGVGSRGIDFYNLQLVPAYKVMVTQQKEILDRQEKEMEDLIAIDQAASKLFGYFPRQDLEVLDLNTSKGRDELVARANNANVGIGIISDNLKKVNQELFPTGKVIDNITKLQGDLQKLSDVTTKGMVVKAEKTREQVIDSFWNLKEEMYGAELQWLRSETILKLITDQTNLIIKYDYWLKRLADEKRIVVTGLE